MSCTCGNFKARETKVHGKTYSITVCLNCGSRPPLVTWPIEDLTKRPDDSPLSAGYREHLKSMSADERRKLLLGEWTSTPLLEDKEMLTRLRSWFHLLQDRAEHHLEREDYILGSYIYHALEQPTPKSILENL